MTARSLDSLAGIPVDGVPFASVTLAETEQLLGHEVDAGRGGVVATVNLDILRQITRSPQLRDLWGKRVLIVADGMPIVWASKLAGTPLPERVAGSDLIWSVARIMAPREGSVALIGGNPGAAEAAADVLRGHAPGVEFSLIDCPPMGFDKDEAYLKGLVTKLIEAKPAIVLVGLGFPKQDRLIARLRDAHADAWYIGVGISFSFVAGEVHRAPPLIQKLGLEWVHRMVQEPGRLFKRYIVHDIPYLAGLIVRTLLSRLRGGRARHANGGIA